MARRKALPDWAGLRTYTKARSTGTHVAVVDGIEGGYDLDGGRWQTICDEHAAIVSHKTLAMAMTFRSCPEEWCGACMGEEGWE